MLLYISNPHSSHHHHYHQAIGPEPAHKPMTTQWEVQSWILDQSDHALCQQSTETRLILEKSPNQHLFYIFRSLF